jgi:hypothetical protein
MLLLLLLSVAFAGGGGSFVPVLNAAFAAARATQRQGEKNMKKN